MKRLILCAVLASLALVFAPYASAQVAKKIPLIGFLSPVTRAGHLHLVEGLAKGLRELGYLDGQNISFEYRWAEGKFDKLPELAAELVRLKVDVLVAVVTQASLAAKNATATIPVVMIAVANPVDSGIVASLARPGANVTGTSIMADEVVGKQLELLKEALPKVSLVGAMWNPANPVFQKLQLKAVESVAQGLGVKLRKVEARDPGEIDRAFAALAKERITALHVIPDPVFTTHRQRIADLAIKYRLPAITGFTELAEAGLLMSYSASFGESARRAAIYVDRILKGTKPADLPVERPTKFEFVVNLKTAKQIGLEFPPNLLVRADRVIR